MEIKRERAELR